MSLLGECENEKWVLERKLGDPRFAAQEVLNVFTRDMHSMPEPMLQRWEEDKRVALVILADELERGKT